MSPRVSLKRTTLFWSNRCFSAKTSMTSTYDSAQIISTLPPQSDLDDEENTDIMTSSLYSQEREGSTDLSRVCHSFRKKLSVHLSRYGKCWLHHSTYMIEASADRSRVYQSFREYLVSSSSHFRKCAGKPVAMFSHKRKSSQQTFLDREGISSRRQ